MDYTLDAYTKPTGELIMNCKICHGVEYVIVNTSTNFGEKVPCKCVTDGNKKVIKFKWETLFMEEKVNHTIINGSMRAKVFGGWIVRSMSHTFSEKNLSSTESSVFIPDRNHEWEVK